MCNFCRITTTYKHWESYIQTHTHTHTHTHTNTQWHTRTHTHTHTHIYIYIYRERERESERQQSTSTQSPSSTQTPSYYTNTYTHKPSQTHTLIQPHDLHSLYTQHNNDERHSSEKNIPLTLLKKGCVWEGVGDRTELQHFDPHSIGHNRVSFPFSWVAQPGAWRPSLSGCWFSLQHHFSNSSDPQTGWISCALSYRIVQHSLNLFP